ncbi:MAG: septum site-determining protein MinD [Clostridia bacterium]|nr:septum site-determining protein MinD [Clostridia bacterium]
MSEIILVASGKGGTGKTAVTAALACALAREGRKVAAVDCDFGLRNLDIALGLAEQVVFDIGDVVSGRADLEKALLPHPDFPGLYLLPSTVPGSERLEEEGFAELCEELRENFDYVLLDAPAGIGSGLRFICPRAQRAFIVTTPDTPCIRDSVSAVGILEEYSISDVRLILNRVDRKRLKKGSSWTVDGSMDELGLRLFGLVREDRAVSEAFCEGVPLLKTASVAGRDIECIAARLCGKRVSNERFRGFF